MTIPRELHFSDAQVAYTGLLLDYSAPRTVLALPDWRGHQTGYALRRGIELGRAIGANVVVSDLFGIDYRPAAYTNDAEHWIAAALADPQALRQRLTGYVLALERNASKWNHFDEAIPLQLNADDQLL